MYGRGPITRFRREIVFITLPHLRDNSRFCFAITDVWLQQSPLTFAPPAFLLWPVATCKKCKPTSSIFSREQRHLWRFLKLAIFFFRSRSLLLPSPSRYRFAYTALATLRPYLHSCIFFLRPMQHTCVIIGIPLYKDAFSVDLELIFLASPAFAA